MLENDICGVGECSFCVELHGNESNNAVRCPDQGSIRVLEEKIPQLMHQAGVTGLSMAVICEGKTFWLHSFGVKNTTTKQAVGDDTIFEAK